MQRIASTAIALSTVLAAAAFAGGTQAQTTSADVQRVTWDGSGYRYHDGYRHRHGYRYYRYYDDGYRWRRPYRYRHYYYD